MAEKANKTIAHYSRCLSNAPYEVTLLAAKVAARGTIFVASALERRGRIYVG